MFGVMIANVVVQIQVVDIFDNQVVFGSVSDLVFPAIIFAVKRYRRQGDDHVIDYQNDVGPLVADLEALAMVEPLDIFGVKTASMLDGTVD